VTAGSKRKGVKPKITERQLKNGVNWQGSLKQKRKKRAGWLWVLAERFDVCMVVCVCMCEGRSVSVYVCVCVKVDLCVCMCVCV
jgi:hypothetical protein